VAGDGEDVAQRRAPLFWRHPATPFRGPDDSPGAQAIDLQGTSATAPDIVHDPLARQVVALVLDGDRDTFRLLVERESAMVLRTCHRVLGNTHDAEEAAQETFVTAYRALASWRGEAPFGAWLSRIAVRVAIRQAARRGRNVELPWLDPPSDLEESGSAGRSSRDADPAVLALQAERSAHVRDAVARLDEPYREVVALRFFGDLSLAEIATVSGRPVPTVKTHLRRGLMRLRAHLEDER
jgi:RNA polymerase sigma-70 factor, ECF subfamily